MQGESPPCLLLPPCACRFSLPASVGESHGKALAENQAGREGEEDKGTVDAGRTRRDPRARAELGTEQWAQHAAGFSRWAGQQPTGHSQKLLKGWRGGDTKVPERTEGEVHSPRRRRVRATSPVISRKCVRWGEPKVKLASDAYREISGPDRVREGCPHAAHLAEGGEHPQRSHSIPHSTSDRHVDTSPAALRNIEREKRQEPTQMTRYFRALRRRP